MTAINYLIDEDRITFMRDQEISIVEKNTTFMLYDSLKTALVNNESTLYFDPKEWLVEAFEQRKNMFGIAERLEQIEAAGMPIEPYMAFINRLSPTVFAGSDTTLIETLVQKIGTVEAPLTWDGDIVLYQRSAWANSNTAWASSGGEFTPFNIVTAGATGELVAGEFSYTMGKCPDLGCAYEVTVQPNHVLNVNSVGVWKVSQVMQLAQLGKEMTTLQQSESPIVRYENKCIGDESIVMRLPYSPVTAASVAEFMMRHNRQLELVNAPVVQAVSC